MAFFKQPVYISSKLRYIHTTIPKNKASLWSLVSPFVSKVLERILLRFEEKRLTIYPPRPLHHLQPREKELKSLQELIISLQKTRDKLEPDAAVILFVSALPGMGKTQLVREFAKRFHDKQNFLRRKQAFIGTLVASSKRSFQWSYEQLAKSICHTFRRGNSMPLI